MLSSSVRAVADLDERLERWRGDLAAWAIPEHITAAVPESPWVLPRQVFARRADRLRATPSGPSYQRAWAALDPPGSVLAVGSGAGAACPPLPPPPPPPTPGNPAPDRRATPAEPPPPPPT